MVVEGSEDTRIAIECDGDRYHGIDKWEEDMNRQRILERAGWNFWRCFASSFIMNKEQVIDDLVNTLKNNKIEPIQSDVHSHQNIYSQTKRVRVFLPTS